MTAVIRAVALARELPPTDGDLALRDRLLLEGLTAPTPYEWYWALRQLCTSPRPLSPAIERRVDTLAVCGDSHLQDAAARALGCASPETRWRAVLRLLKCPEVQLQTHAASLAEYHRCPATDRRGFRDLPQAERPGYLRRVEACVREKLREASGP